MNLSELSINDLPSIGTKGVTILKQLKINSVFDLLMHMPYDYSDRTEVVPIALINVDEPVSIEGIITRNYTTNSLKKEMYNLYLEDETGGIKIVFFNLKAFQKMKLQNGRKLKVFGKAKIFNNQLSMTAPEICYIEDQATNLTPKYHLTKNLKMSTMRKYAVSAVEMLKKFPLEELIPSNLLPDNINLTFSEALALVHCPPQSTDIELLKEFKHPAQLRIFLDELVAHQLGLIKFKQSIKQNSATKLPKVPQLNASFLENLPYKPTNAQMLAFEAISNDLTRDIPMNRLVQGDVGSGKTLVAMLATLQAIGNGVQVAVMVPTEILAKQHAISFNEVLAKLGFKTVCLVGQIKAKEKREIIKEIASGDIDVIIGTHAIFQKDITYHNLALMIIDEQHRFGVKQRLQLKEKGKQNNFHPHMLSMSATPIPRTLAQTLYYDLDISIVNELPPGRTPVKTFLLSTNAKQKLLDRIAVHCNQGHQVYWVCCLIEESDTLDCQDAENALKFLQHALPQFNIALIHGKLKQQEKQAIMQNFSNGNIDILVATSVIEVGVNVPNAFLIVIENAERHGLAQLHQLRGRVGRGKLESYCCLLCNDNISSQSKERLQTLINSNDGFYLAQKDLEFRGPGDLLGTEQTGAMNFKVANLLTDASIIDQANNIARQISDHYPNLIHDILARWYPEGETLSEI